jgi:Arc/MetJ-type ribon-helix-helix transcriptional regulator
MVMRTISLKLPDDLLATLESQARKRRVTKSAVVRESLEKALNQQPSSREVSCYDLARDLAGSIKGLPNDLAHDPKYMRGFGE